MKLYAVTSFRGEFFYLSNFYGCNVKYKGLDFLSAEAAFQSAKTPELEIRKLFTTMNPKEAKSFARTLLLPEDWEYDRVGVMRHVVMEKFIQNPHLKQRLLDTLNTHLIEVNDWNDTFWGCIVSPEGLVGDNWLGKIVMETRMALRYDYHISSEPPIISKD